jgi:hypothetical protein
MTDHRTKRQKLEAMARQTVSPHEAEVARLKLAAMGDTKAPANGPRFSPYDQFRYSHTPTPPATFTAEDLARVRDELRHRTYDDLFDLWRRTSGGFYDRPVPTPPCERCRHPHMATVCKACGPLGPCGSTCQRCRHGQHRGVSGDTVCYWCATMSTERRTAGPCAPGYDPNWDAYVSGTECPRCHAGHHSPIYCTGAEAQP